MTIFLHIASITLLGLGGLVALLNGWALIRQLLGKHSPSTAPILGGIFLFVGALLFPGGELRPWAVIGLFLDYGCLPYLILVSISMAQETRRYAEKNRILSLQFETAACSGEIFVYSENECIYKWAAKDGLSSGSMIMKVDEYIARETLSLSIQNTVVTLGVHNGAWRLDSEQGWHSPIHSLASSTITQTAANKSLNTDREDAVG